MLASIYSNALCTLSKSLQIDEVIYENVYLLGT